MQLEFTVTGLKPRQRRRRASAPKQRPVAPVVRTLVLAYQIDQAVREGRARDYAEVARQIGMTRARVSQIMNLLRLSPALIETLLSNYARLPRLTERQLRPVVSGSEPHKQRELFDALLATIESE